MTDLSDFGVDVPDADQSANSDADSSTGTGYGQSHSYRRGRCRAVSTSTMLRRRCRSPCSGGDLCAAHAREDRSPTSGPLTIDDDPRELIRWTSSNAARCRAIQNDGSRCTNGCGPTEYVCGIHEDADCELVDRDELEDDELDVDLIRAALDAVSTEEVER